MNFDIVKVGMLQTNCYIIETDNKVLIIDPGDNYEKIMKSVNNKEIVGVIITHYHHDHIGALNNFNEDLIYDCSNLKEGNNVIGPFSFNTIYTPGHKADSITIYFEEDKKMFTGDFLFRDTIGRTDLPTSSVSEMMNSLKKIFEYPENIEVYPGHGSSTTIAREKRNNLLED